MPLPTRCNAKNKHVHYHATLLPEKFAYICLALGAAAKQAGEGELEGRSLAGAKGLETNLCSTTALTPSYGEYFFSAEDRDTRVLFRMVLVGQAITQSTCL